MRALCLLLALSACDPWVRANGAPFSAEQRVRDETTCMQLAGIGIPAEDHLFPAQRQAFEGCMKDKGWRE